MASRSEEKDARVNKMAESLKPPKGKFRSMHIEAADNGYTVHTERDLPPSTKEKDGGSNGAADQGGAVMPTMDNADNSHTVFQNEDDVVDHVQKHLTKPRDGKY